VKLSMNILRCIVFEVLTAVVMKSYIFWNVMLCCKCTDRLATSVGTVSAMQEALERSPLNYSDGSRTRCRCHTAHCHHIVQKTPKMFLYNLHCLFPHGTDMFYVQNHTFCLLMVHSHYVYLCTAASLY
jgi:hypothetical protein